MDEDSTDSKVDELLIYVQTLVKKQREEVNTLYLAYIKYHFIII